MENTAREETGFEPAESAGFHDPERPRVRRRLLLSTLFPHRSQDNTTDKDDHDCGVEYHDEEENYKNQSSKKRKQKPGASKKFNVMPLRGKGRGRGCSGPSQPSPLPTRSPRSQAAESCIEGTPIINPTHMASSVAGIKIDRRSVISVERVQIPKRFVPQSVTRAIMANVLIRMSTPADKWRNYPTEVKEALFEDFMAQYRFASEYDRCMARLVWERTCMERYSDMLKNARNAALKAVNSTNLADTKGHGPRGMKTEVWDGLVNIWLTPEWQRKSDAGRTNRAAMPQSSLHTGGSISFGQHKQRMEVQMQHPVSYRDVYNRTHKKKSGEYVSEHAKKFIKTLDISMSQKYGEDSSLHPIIDPAVWLDVAGTNKKGRIYGIGHSLDLGIH